MPKSLRLVLLAIAIVCTACSSQLPASTAQPPTATLATPVLQPTSGATASATAEATLVVEQTIVAPEGLRVVYLRDGNLWSWTETSGHVMLTGTGDMSTARLSSDGQLLAFIRGREAWTIRMDGTGARLLVTLEDEGGALWFAPDGSQLAISTADHIDVVDLLNETVTTVFTYPAIAEGYYPELVWTPDGSGFKTVIPSASENGQAEFLFVFANGTVASLAKFAMVSPSESLPFISPDGGYVVYVAALNDGQVSLRWMDSSGASKPYGKPAKSLRVYGWLPDSKTFLYAQEDTEQAFLGNVTASGPTEIDLADYEILRWVEADRFLAISRGNLYIGELDGGKSLIAEDVSDFDFAN